MEPRLLRIEMKPLRLLGVLVSLACALGLVVIMGACNRTARKPPGPNVVLLMIDTLRADRLSCYGHTRKTSPFLDSLAGQGILFENAYAPSSWTVPSMASIFTGLYPRQHGCVHGFVNEEEKSVVRQENLAQDFITLAERMKRAGYTTFGVSANPHLSKETGFAQGFDHFETLWLADAQAVNNAVKGMEKEIRNADKYFLFVFYIDPHAPYDAREPWISTYNSDPATYGPWAGLTPRQRDEKTTESTGLERNQRLLYLKRAREAMLDLYDSEINYCDHFIQELFETLGLHDDLVVVSSDHGEEFLEHFSWDHSKTLYEELVRVPLIVKRPGEQTPRRVTALVSNRNILPTVLDAAGVESVKDEKHGQSLLSMADEGGKEEGRSIYLEVERYPKFSFQAMRRDDWKLICGPNLATTCSLYDLRADPYEGRSVFESQPTLSEELTGTLKSWISAHPRVRASESSRTLSDEEVRKLKALGYL